MPTTRQLFKNNAESTANGTIAVGAGLFNVAAGHGARFPTPGAGTYAVVTLYEKNVGGVEINHEAVKVTAIAGDTLTISRDFEGAVIGAGGTSGGWAYPSAPGINPSGIVYVQMRYTAFAAGNNLTKDGNLEGLESTATARTNIGLGNVDNTSDANKPVSTAQAAADNLRILTSSKDASGGVPGLTLFKLNLRNAANTITSWFTTAATVDRTWTLPDKDGTVAMMSDITGTNSGTNTGDETLATIKTKLGVTTLSGANTGDQTALTTINTPAGNIAATTVQAAINELDTEKLAANATALNGTTIPASKTLVVTTDIGSSVQAYSATLAGIAAGTTATSGRNKLINCTGVINQLALVSPVTLAAGAYGHDGFKGGAGGCTYSFVVTANKTVFTITAGTLMQIANGKYLQSGTMTLGWDGTAQARIDLGAYAASPLTGTAVGGTNQSCEWGLGTLSLPQYEPGSIRTSAEIRDDEKLRCQQYYQRGFNGLMGAVEGSATVSRFVTVLPVEMNATPVVSLIAGVSGVGAIWQSATGPLDVASLATSSATKTSLLLQLITSTAGNAARPVSLDIDIAALSARL